MKEAKNMGLMRKESLEEEYSKILDDLGLVIDTEIEEIKENEEFDHKK